MKLTNPNTSNSLILALLLSVFGYVLFLATTGNYFVKTALTRFELVTSQVDNYKQKLLVLSLLTESEIDRLEGHSAETINDSINLRYRDAIYSTNDQALTLEESVVRSVMHRAISFLPDFINNPDIKLMYRSFAGEKFIMQRPSKGFEAKAEYFTDEHCVITQTCSKYAWADQLQDRVIISSIHTDTVTGRPAISIAVPVTTHSSTDATIQNEDIIGEYIVNLYLDNAWLHDKEIDVSYRGRTKHFEILYKDYWFNTLAFRSTYVADNMSIFTYNYPMSKLLTEQLFFFLVMFVATYLLHVKSMESKQHKSQLVNAISNATTDELTNLHNRKLFKSKLFKEVLSKKGTALIAIDGNSIKAINDQHGHHAGDVAIKHIANSMRATFRKSDYLVRNGGDEFLAILPDCSRARADELAQSLQQAVQRTPILEQQLYISIATGVTYREIHEPIEQAIIRADQNLYEHKKQLLQQSKSEKSSTETVNSAAS
ncbi:GGDEF domain-containing protein [Vibrio hippocampi]|nr:GGDEF domain-containing protein [Vibrio hippocampi]